MRMKPRASSENDKEENEEREEKDGGYMRIFLLFLIFLLFFFIDLMKILVVGGGGREHALVWKFAQSHTVKKIYCAPGNPGTAELAENVEIAADDVQALAEFAEDRHVNFTFVGPEAPLVKGIVGEFQKRKLPVVGPSQAAAQLEGSKVFAKQLMSRFHIPTAPFEAFEDEGKALDYLKGHRGPCVIKADGLAQGKGVVVADSFHEAREAVIMMMRDQAFGSAGKKIIIEEKLEGEEVSMLAFTDGHTVLPMEPSQDHKRLLNQDQGPNTGGMGAYSPVLSVDTSLRQRVLKEILTPAVQGMENMGRPFSGILYAGLMLTTDGPKALEFNVRFGDPETQALLPRLKTDLAEIAHAMAYQELNQIRLDWSEEHAACVVMAASGYPQQPLRGKVIKGLEDVAKMPKVLVFHAGTAFNDSEIVTMGGRILGVTGLGPTLKEAITRAYLGVNKIHFEGAQFRTDIGWRGSVRNLETGGVNL